MKSLDNLGCFVGFAAIAAVLTVGIVLFGLLPERVSFAHAVYTGQEECQPGAISGCDKYLPPPGTDTSWAGTKLIAIIGGIVSALIFFIVVLGDDAPDCGEGGKRKAAYYDGDDVNNLKKQEQGK